MMNAVFPSDRAFSARAYPDPHPNPGSAVYGDVRERYEAEILDRLAEATGGEAFTCAELLKKAEGLPELWAMLLDAGLTTSRKVGRFLGRLRGCPGITVEYCGTEKMIGLWKVRRA